MTAPSPHPTEQLSSLLTPGENPGSFQQDWIPYEMERELFASGQITSVIGSDEARREVFDYSRLDRYNSWQSVPPVSDEDKRSDTYLRSHMQGLEDCLTRLEEALSRMETAQQRTLQVLESLVDSLADEDEDEPARYLDGRLI